MGSSLCIICAAQDDTKVRTDNTVLRTIDTDLHANDTELHTIDNELSARMRKKFENLCHPEQANLKNERVEIRAK